MKIDWKRKLSSRKLWIAITGLIVGIVILFTRNESLAGEIGGIIMSLGSVVGYLLAEGLTDVASLQGKEEEDINDDT